MAKTVSVAEAKNQLSDLLSRVGYGGERFLIERHGKPVGALVSPEDLRQLDRSAVPKPRGLLALYGDTDGLEEFADLMDEIIQARSLAHDREVDLE